MATTARLTLFCLTLGVGLGVLGLLKGGLYADRYDGDTLHLVEMVLRLAGGGRAHINFMTPIGVLALGPVAAFVGLGFGVGLAFVLAQLAAALLLLPAILHVARSRFSGIWAYGWSALILVLVLALVHGGADPSVSLSMHYNRWAWALTAIAVPIAFLPARRPGARADAVILGAVMAGLVLIKATFFVAVAPAVVLLLLIRGDWRLLAGAVAAGVAALLAATLLLGVAHWPAYLGDLLATARSAGRAYPGLALPQVLTGPGYLAGHVLALGAVVILRRCGQAQAGLGMLLLLPGLIYVTFQNFGNDPMWFALVGLMLPMVRPVTADAQGAHRNLTMIAVALLALASPVLTNMAFSPIRHFSSAPEGFARMLPRSGRHDDLFIDTGRADGVSVRLATSMRAEAADPPVPARLPDGEELAECSLSIGITRWNDHVARDLDAAGIEAGARVLVADLLSPLWLYSERLEPVNGAAPWWYGATPGLTDATHLLIPTCPIDPEARAEILRLAGQGPRDMTEIRRGPDYILMRLAPAADQPVAAATTR